MSQLNADSSDDEGGVSAFYIMIINHVTKPKSTSFSYNVVIEQKNPDFRQVSDSIAAQRMRVKRRKVQRRVKLRRRGKAN